MVIDSNTFTGNHADIEGGAIYSDSDLDLTVIGNTFNLNTADLGGNSISIILAGLVNGESDPGAISAVLQSDNTNLLEDDILIF